MAKVSDVAGLSPRAMDVGEAGGSSDGDSDGGVRLKKELGLLNGVGIIVGVIVGSGIFVSPSFALERAGSKGMALILWVISGGLSMTGALCYAELGTMIPKSGGDYAYLGEVYGALPSFLYLWVAMFVLVPTGNAVTAITFAQNILQPFWPECLPPDAAVGLIAAALTCLITAINCYNVKWVTRLQDAFTAAKMLALVLTFLASVVYMFKENTDNLTGMMEGTVTDPGDLGLAVYSGLFSYSGWNYLNFVTEELRDPYKNLPRAICISIPVVITIYVFTNVGFFAVLTSNQIIAAKAAVAVKFSSEALGVMSWIMPVFVALCTFGSLNGAIYASSRLLFVGARNGHLPLAISLIDVRRLTPVPSLIFMCIVTLAMLLVSDLESLIIYVTSVEALFTIASVAGVLWMRWTRPDLERPIRVNLILPIAYLLICSLLVILAGWKSPMPLLYGLLIVAVGVPVYYVFIKCEKAQWLNNACDSFNLACSKMFLSLPEDSKEL